VLSLGREFEDVVLNRERAQRSGKVKAVGQEDRKTSRENVVDGFAEPKTRRMNTRADKENGRKGRALELDVLLPPTGRRATLNARPVPTVQAMIQSVKYAESKEQHQKIAKP